MVQSPIMNPGDTHWCQTPVKNRYNQVLQDGKVIGAVTHVFVQDSTSGYGIFIENMLRNTRKQVK